MKKAAVIGLGDIAPIHIGAIAVNDEIELCAVCDINPAAKERAPQGIPFYTDYEEMIQALLNREIDMIFYVGRNPFFAEENGYALTNTA